MTLDTFLDTVTWAIVAVGATALLVLAVAVVARAIEGDHRYGRFS